MNGQTKLFSFTQKKKIAEDYIARCNPYKNADSMQLDLRAMTKYARKKGIKLAELNEVEIQKFHKE